MTRIDLGKAIFGGPSNSFTASDSGASYGVGGIRGGTVVDLEGGGKGVLLDGSDTPVPFNGQYGAAGTTVATQGGTQILTGGTVADFIVSRERHSFRDAIVTTWASGRVQVEGTIEKNHRTSESRDQLPSITDFKQDATYSKSIVLCCNGDYTIRPIFISGAGAVDHSGAVFCEWRQAYSGNARINYYYDLR